MDNTPTKKTRKLKKAAPPPSGPKCGICGLYEMDCVGHLGVSEHFLTFPNGRVVEQE